MIDSRIIGIIIFILLTLIIVISQVARNRDPLPEDEDSIRRTKTLRNVLQGLYGDWWPAVLTIILLLSLSIIGLLFYLTFHTQIDVSDKQYKWIQVMKYAWLIIVGVGLTVYITTK